MKNYPIYTNRKVSNLHGLWDFTFLGGDINSSEVDLQKIKFDDVMDVPMAFDATPNYAGKKGLFAYRTILQITSNTNSLLKIGGMGMWNAFYLDGELIHINSLPYSGITIPILPSDKESRELIVLCDNRINHNTTPLFSHRFDFYSYGGFFRSVELHELPTNWIDRAYITTLNLEEGLLGVKLNLKGTVSNGKSLIKKLKVSISSKELPIQNLQNEGMSFNFNLKIENPVEWSLENPFLYQFCFDLGFDQVIESFGLRTIETKGKDILLNGKAVKLKGYCRHEAHPQFGPALPYGQLVQDLQILKDLGCNFVRGAHYPQDQRFLDLCDKLGILVFEETLGWQNNSEDFNNPDYFTQQEEQTKLMVRNSFNHPSVIIWGFLNEGDSHEASSKEMYIRLAEILREEDSSRLITYATNHILEDKYLDLCDIISVNMYPGWYSLGEHAWYSQGEGSVRPLMEIDNCIDVVQKHLSVTGQGKKPLILSEIGAGAIYGWRDPIQGIWSENYQADYLETVCNRVVNDKGIAGVSLWQFSDCRTYQTARAIGRPRSFNNKGILDEYRRPKMGYEVVKKIFRSN